MNHIKYMSEIGRRGGSKTSEAKKLSGRRNCQLALEARLKKQLLKKSEKSINSDEKIVTNNP